MILVGGYSGLGVHTLLNAVRFVPHHFKNMIFISVGVVDSGNFKGVEELDGLRNHIEGSLEKYVDLARRLGFPATSYMAIGTDVVDELEQLCRVVHRDFPKSVVFAGQLVFQRETWYGASAQPNRLLAAAAVAVGRRADGHSADTRPRMTTEPNCSPHARPSWRKNPLMPKGVEHTWILARLHSNQLSLAWGKNKTAAYQPGLQTPKSVFHFLGALR